MNRFAGGIGVDRKFANADLKVRTQSANAESQKRVFVANGSNKLGNNGSAPIRLTHRPCVLIGTAAFCYLRRGRAAK